MKKRISTVLLAFLICAGIVLTACSAGTSLSQQPAGTAVQNKTENPGAVVSTPLSTSKPIATAGPTPVLTPEATVKPAPTQAPLTFGATGGNLLNGGSWCFKDDVLYGMQRIASNKFGIFAQKKDGSIKLAEGIGSQLNVADGFLYYLSYPNGILYKVPLDASKTPVKLSEDKMLFLLVAGDRIYYTLDSNAALYVTTIDGSGKKLVSDGKCYDLGGYGNLVYYTDIKSKSFCMINTFTGKVASIPMSGRGFVQIIGERVYYQNEADGKKLYSCKLDGTDSRMIYDKAITGLNAAGEAVYFADNSGSGKIFLMNPSGDGMKQVAGIKAEFISICDQELYIVSNQKTGTIYNLNKNGELKKLS